MTIGLTYPELLKLQPCTESLKRVRNLLGGAEKWNGKTVTAQRARDAGCTFEDIVWAASAMARSNSDVERRLRLWMADCAARVMHLYEREYPNDDRVRNAIIVARQFARDEIDKAAARDAAWAAAWAAAGARAAAGAAAGAAAATRAAARDAAWDAAWAVAWNAAVAWDAEHEWQYMHLVARLSDPEPDDVPFPDRINKLEVAA